MVHDHPENHSARGKLTEQREPRERNDIDGASNRQEDVETMLAQELLHCPHSGSGRHETQLKV
jgi:hypothetical protein